MLIEEREEKVIMLYDDVIQLPSATIFDFLWEHRDLYGKDFRLDRYKTWVESKKMIDILICRNEENMFKWLTGTNKYDNLYKIIHSKLDKDKLYTNGFYLNGMKMLYGFKKSKLTKKVIIIVDDDRKIEHLKSIDILNDKITVEKIDNYCDETVANYVIGKHSNFTTMVCNNTEIPYKIINSLDCSEKSFCIAHLGYNYIKNENDIYVLKNNLTDYVDEVGVGISTFDPSINYLRKY